MKDLSWKNFGESLPPNNEDVVVQLEFSDGHKIVLKGKYHRNSHESEEYIGHIIPAVGGIQYFITKSDKWRNRDDEGRDYGW